MNVIHLPVVIANNSVVLSRYLQRLGVSSKVISYFRTWLDYGADINLDLDRLGARERQERLRAFVEDFLEREAANYDIFHFHFFDTLAGGTSFGGWESHPERPGYWDLAALKAMGKKIVVSCFGSEVRNNSKVTWYQLRYDDPALALPRPPLCTRSQYLKVWQVAQYADALVCGDTELAPHVPFSTMIPVPIDLEPLSALKTAAGPPDEPFSILHAPSNNLFKGSRYIVRVLEDLKRGYGGQVEVRLIHGVPAQEAVRGYPGRGVAIDQINMSFGLFALEAMYLGRPVICALRPEEFAAGDPKLAAPVVSVGSEAELRRVLAEFIEGRRQVRPEELEAYVREHHEAGQVARQYLALYERLLDGEEVPHMVSRRWLAQFDRLIKGERLDQEGYYSQVTDLLLARRDADLLVHEIQQGLGLADDAELLAKLVLIHAAAGQKEAADKLVRANSRVAFSAPYKGHFERAREILAAGSL